MLNTPQANGGYAGHITSWEKVISNAKHYNIILKLFVKRISVLRLATLFPTFEIL